MTNLPSYNFFKIDFARQNSAEFAQIWKAKCEQIIAKVKVLKKNDRELIENIVLYAKEIGIKI
jgi:hypothetical protein